MKCTCCFCLCFERQGRVLFFYYLDLGLKACNRFRRHTLNFGLVCDKKCHLAYNAYVMEGLNLLYARTVCFLDEFAPLGK